MPADVLELNIADSDAGCGMSADPAGWQGQCRQYD